MTIANKLNITRSTRKSLLKSNKQMMLDMVSTNGQEYKKTQQDNRPESSERTDGNNVLTTGT